VHGIGIVRYPDAVSGQLVTKSYRPGAGDRRRRFQSGDARTELFRPADERLPDPRSRGGVEGGEDLAAKAVEHGQPLALGSRLGDPQRQRVQRADAAGRQPGRGGQAKRGGDPDPQPGEGAGTGADREQVDLAPPARRGRRALDLAQQRGRVPRPPGRGEPQLRLVQDLAVAPGAGDGVDRRGIEADDDQLGSAPPVNS
jgi:hypothetical protein